MVIQTSELDKILFIITSNIEEAMAALHAIQTATIEAQGQSLEHQYSQFQEIRRHLKEYWEDIATFLKSCYSFADYVGRLHAASQSTNKAQLSEFLEELTINCKKCRNEAQKLIGEHQISIQCYRQYEPQFSAILRRRSRSNRSKRRRGDSHDNGEESMAKFVGSCDGLGKSVQELATLFAQELESCKRYSEAVGGTQNSVSLKETEEFAKKWIESEEMVFVACSAITTVCDVVMIPATSLPDPSDPVKPRNWFEGLWSIFVTWLGVQTEDPPSTK